MSNMSSGEPTCKEFLQVDREQAIARVIARRLYPLADLSQDIWADARMECEELARAIIASDPWTQEYVSLKLGHTWNQVHLAEAADVIAELRAEVERLRSLVGEAYHLLLNHGDEEAEYFNQALTEKQDG